jgi:hypothetical protein
MNKNQEYLMRALVTAQCAVFEWGQEGLTEHGAHDKLKQALKDASIHMKRLAKEFE